MKNLTPRSSVAGWLALLMLSAATTANAQFKIVGPAPYTATVARQKIKALLGKLDPANRQQSISTLSGLLSWYRDIADEELIATWKQGDGRQNLPDAIKALADARVALAVVEFSWRQQRQATFQPANAPMFEDLMLRFPDSAQPFLDDLLGSKDPVTGEPGLDLPEPVAYTVCRILLDMPDIRTWKASALKILPRYRDAAETLLAADANEGDEEKRYNALRWSAALKSTAAAQAPSPRVAMAPPASPDAKSGTLECAGDPIPQNGEYVFRNVPTTNRRFDYDRKIWDVRLVPGDGGAQNLILKNKSSRTQKGCEVRWSVIP